MKQVKITIPRRGLATKAATVKTDVFGCQGAGCKRITDIFNAAFGTLKTEVVKPELYEEPQVGHEEIEESAS